SPARTGARVMSTVCPAPDLLRQYALGAEVGAAADALDGHLAGCTACLATLERLHGQGPLDGALRALSGARPLSNPLVEGLRRHAALQGRRPGRSAEAAARERFLREARLLAGLTHDHLVTVYEADEEGGTPFLAMQFLHGQTLEARLHGGPLPLAEALRVAR